MVAIAIIIIIRRADQMMIDNESLGYGEDMWTQGLFISMYDKIHYK